MRAIAVRRPFAVPVIQLLHRIFGVSIFTAGAGVAGIAVLSTGGLYDALLIIVFQRRKFHIGGVIAARAGIVFVPADFRAGCRFRFVLFQIMVQSGNLFISGMRTALTLAGIVCVPADFRAVRCLRIVMHRIVTRRGNLFIGGRRTALALAGYVSIPAHFRAGRRFRFVLFQIVTRRNLYMVV